MSGSHLPIIHIGHHFFGAGNIGDDLMLAGFLEAWEQSGKPCKLTCSIPFSIDSQQRRFPEIEWRTYDLATRESAIEACDVWLGLGGAPFQTDTGSWMLDHLMEELALCEKYRKPIYFLGVGANNWEAFRDPRTRAVLSAATHVWTRDWQTAVHAIVQCGADRVSAGADLANIYLQRQTFLPSTSGQAGWVLNFESAGQFDSLTFGHILGGLPDWRHAWLIQEVRALPGAEKTLWESLQEQDKLRLMLRDVDYDNASLEELGLAWQSPEVLVSSRYHGLLIGAWMGARLVGIGRNDKVAGLIAQLGIPHLNHLLDAGAAVGCVERSFRLDRNFLERELAMPALAHCREFFGKACA